MTLESLISLDILYVAAPIYFAFIVIEVLAIKYFKRPGQLEARDDAISIFMGVVSLLSNGAAAFLTLAMLVWAQQFQIHALPLTVSTLIACFILDDLRYYLHHRIAHRCRWPWAMHIIHHSSQRFSFAVALRQGWTKHFTGTTVLKIPLVLIGFDPLMVIFCGGLNAVYQFFLHTETVDRMPRWFEAVFNTPSHHRVHHGKNPKYLDANYAGTLIIWDKMFGSFVPERDDEPVRYGIVRQLGSFNILWAAVHEWVGIAKDVWHAPWKHKLDYIWREPGWSHDGSRATSAMIKERWAAGRTSEEAAE